MAAKDQLAGESLGSTGSAAKTTTKTNTATSTAKQTTQPTTQQKTAATTAATTATDTAAKTIVRKNTATNTPATTSAQTPVASATSVKSADQIQADEATRAKAEAIAKKQEQAAIQRGEETAARPAVSTVRSRETNVTGTGKDVDIRGEGLGTGPVSGANAGSIARQASTVSVNAYDPVAEAKADYIAQRQAAEAQKRAEQAAADAAAAREAERIAKKAEDLYLTGQEDYVKQTPKPGDGSGDLGGGGGGDLGGGGSGGGAGVGGGGGATGGTQQTSTAEYHNVNQSPVAQTQPGAASASATGSGVNVPETPDLKPILDAWREAAEKNQQAQIDYATQKGIEELQRAQEDAQKQFKAAQEQISAEEAWNKDNQALYAEARGDKGGIGAAQYDSIMNTAAINRQQVREQQTQLATDTWRQIADLRAQGEYKKADAVLQIAQTYLSNLMELEQWAANYGLSAAQFAESIREWEANFEAQVASITGYYKGQATYAREKEELKAKTVKSSGNGGSTKTVPQSAYAALTEAGATTYGQALDVLYQLGYSDAKAKEMATAYVKDLTAAGGSTATNDIYSLYQQAYNKFSNNVSAAVSWISGEYTDATGYSKAPSDSTITEGYKAWLDSFESPYVPSVNSVSDNAIALLNGMRRRNLPAGSKLAETYVDKIEAAYNRGEIDENDVKYIYSALGLPM